MQGICILLVGEIVYLFWPKHCLRPAAVAACSEARIPALAGLPGSQSEDGMQETHDYLMRVSLSNSVQNNEAHMLMICGMR